MQREAKPSIVGTSPIRDGDIRARWAWAEPSVWTDRMLEALENGVKGGTWYSLMDKVYDPKNLEAAWKKVRRNRGAAGVDRQHSHYWTFERLDRWIRMRLRSILRKRTGGRGRGRGRDHQRWPNAFFVAHGLFTLVAAYEAARQPR